MNTDERSRVLLLVPAVPICLVWAPRAEVINRILDADGKPARDAVLVACEELILDDLDTLRADCTHPQIVDLVEPWSEATSAARAGFHLAAQALCASIVTAILSEHYATPRFPGARKRLEQEIPGKARLRFWRRASVQSVLLGAIAQSWEDDPPPQGFNRYRTAHSVNPAQYTRAHALEALLLVGGLIRELQEIHETGHGGLPATVQGRPPGSATS